MYPVRSPTTPGEFAIVIFPCNVCALQIATQPKSNSAQAAHNREEDIMCSDLQKKFVKSQTANLRDEVLLPTMGFVST
jgi:hypothetical protein